MIPELLSYRRNPARCIEQIAEANEIVFFGTIVFLKYLKLGLRKPDSFRRVTVIVSDTCMIKNKNHVNNELLKIRNLNLLVMPDLIKYIMKGMKYRAYYQHIPKIYDVEKTGLFCHSPGLKLADDLKGTKFIQRSLIELGYPLTVLSGLSWIDCRIEKAKHKYFIDQIVDTKTYTGGIGKSGLEAMLSGCLTFSSGNVPDSTIPKPPVIWVNPGNFKNAVKMYLNDQKLYIEKVNKQRSWAERFTGKDYVLNLILS
jgi:hypothetical protein